MAPVKVKLAAHNFLDFVNASPTPFHAVKSVKERLTAAGFKEIKVSPTYA
jgi:aspartyl aminopeptidase